MQTETDYPSNTKTPTGVIDHMKQFFLIITVLAAGLFAACSSDPPGKMVPLDDAKYFRKVEAKMTLTHSQLRGDYTLGKLGQSLKFLLKNVDVSIVNIDEWYMDETSNIRLYYAFCEHGKANEVPESAWKLAWPVSLANAKTGKKMRHAPLVLQPNNSAMLEVPLTFLETLKPEKKQARYYIALYAQIALNTLDTKSEVFEITAYPKVVDVEIE